MYREVEHATTKFTLMTRAQIEPWFPTVAALAGALDHTLLKPEATEAEVLRLAEEAAEHRFACAMVNPLWVGTVNLHLSGTGVRIGTVVGFPLGASVPQIKRAEALAAIRAGARDIDMVMAIGVARSGFWTQVGDEIQRLAEAVHGEGAILKVILETCLLTDEQKRIVAELCVNAEAEFVKTSTGFSTGGATADDVALLRRTVGDRCGVKASGGIRTLSDAIRMTAAGAGRIGASASVRILREYLDAHVDANE